MQPNRAIGRQAEGQRRQATVLFVDMASYTPTAERLGEENTYLLMRQVLREMADVVGTHKGIVQDLLGDGLLAVFGAPIAREDAHLEACRAAHDIRDRMIALEDTFEREYGVRPKFRIGIHTGPLVVSPEFKAVGDTVNLAARLQSAAEPSAILISDATNKLVSGFFETEFIGERWIKGKSELQRIFALGRLKRESSRFDVAVHRGLTPFVARERELETIERLWAEVCQGRRRFVHLVGEAGIGKSRLIFEFRKTLDPRDFVIGRCTLSGRSTPFGPFIAAIRALFLIDEEDSAQSVAEKLRSGLGELGLNSDEELPYLLNLLGRGGDAALRGVAPEVIGIRTRNALAGVLRQRCLRSPLVVIIEDLHWIDTASEEWLLRLARDDQPLQLLIVTSFRPHYKPQWSTISDVHALELKALSRETTVELLQRRIGVAALPPDLVKVAVEKTEGNPLFLEEITNYLIDNGQIGRRGPDIRYEPPIDGLTLPISLENLFLERFDLLEEGPRRALESASVVGPSFSQELVADVSGLDDTVSNSLATLESKDLIYREPESGRFRFKHALVQDAIYRRLLTSTRQELHELVARSIERRNASNLNEVVDVLANHYAHTRHLDKTARYMALAGANALQVYSLEEAEQRFRRIVELSKTSPGCFDDGFLTDVMTKLARVYYYRGEFYSIIALIEPNLPRIAAQDDKRRHSRLLFEVGYAYVFSARGAVGKPFLEQALAIGEQLGDPESIAYASLGLMFFYLFWGGASENSRHAFAALSVRVGAIAPTLPDVWVTVKWLNCRWGEAVFFSRFAQARELSLELFDLSRASGDPRPMGFGYWQMAITDLYADRYAEAIENANHAMQIALAPLDHLSAHSAQGGAFTLLGRAAEGFAELDKVRRESEERGYLVLVMLIDVFYGASMSLTGHLARGIRWIHESIARIERWGNPHLPVVGYMILGEIYLQIATSSEMPPARVILRNLGFVLANVPFAARKSRRFFEEAIRRCRSIDMPGHLARCLLGLGTLHAARRRIPEARVCLTEALKISEAVRAENITLKVREALTDLE